MVPATPSPRFPTPSAVASAASVFSTTMPLLDVFIPRQDGFSQRAEMDHIGQGIIGLGAVILSLRSSGIRINGRGQEDPPGPEPEPDEVGSESPHIRGPGCGPEPATEEIVAAKRPTADIPTRLVRSERGNRPPANGVGMSGPFECMLWGNEGERGMLREVLPILAPRGRNDRNTYKWDCPEGEPHR